MSATVMFTLAKVDDATAVALSAVFATAEALRYVFLKKETGFEIRPVETGIADTRYVEILSGLKVGDEVARTRPLEFEGEPPVLSPNNNPAQPKAREATPAKGRDPSPPPPRSSGSKRREGS